MRSPLLRKIRILFSAIILICFILVFIDYKDLIPTKYINILMSLQFVPSMLKYIDTPVILSAGFVAVLILTLLTGRTYCSFLCPLGIGQDLFSRIGGRIRKKFRRYGLKKPHTILRYSILGATVVVSLVWGIYLLTLLDPYSVFGRFMTFFGKPVALLINNFLSWVFHKFDIYTFDHITITGFRLLTYTIPVLFFILVGVMSLTRGRLYCNTICPVGTLLGLISKISIFRIKFDESKCTRCGRCAIRCKSSCIDFLQQKVDVSRCVDCFNCIDVCQDDAMSYGLVSFKKKETETDTGKRKFIAGSLLMLMGLQQGARAQEKGSPVPLKQSTVKENRTCPVAPPGAGSIEDFNSNCTGCSLCIAACPNDVLKPALLQYGIAGIMQPVMDYHKSFCTFNCVKCTEVCPTYALKPLTLEAKQLTQLGKVQFIKDNCIVKTEKTACGACSEACPTKAVYMVPYEGNLLIPETNADICIGCGHCEYACPTVPYKAIFVDGNPVHQAAQPPENEEAEMEAHEDFPF
ncbi:MAG TPA: 4Fe-4S binding protein [Bacteroidales bacterium]|nr:4Fe-4S binding protein [Bacteroidales bacterium]HPJ58829.1 4Fe-4S binding protein [Bacteroidales bacterium]HPR10985.1 4Fe-4S binding protein [Bacteroidales bacterium]HRW85891.1 4Fe-4S binding protein [Bacteroidales bacterium]